MTLTGFEHAPRTMYVGADMPLLFMNAYHGASVPSGWIVPFSYVNVGRPQSKDEECAKVRLIVPHSQGHADASSNVKPFYYVITFERES